MNFKALSFLGALSFVLSGCGDIEIPQSLPTPTLSPLETLDTNSLLNPSSTPEATPETLSCTALQKEKENLAEVVTLSEEALKTCEAEKAQLTSLSHSAQSSSSQVKELSPLLKKYLTEIKQEEFKFNACGALGIVTNKEWYTDFQAALTASNIPFSGLERPLKPTDFYSVCFSDEGKTALFLGARADGKNEFHMLKFQFEKKSLSESIILGGTCELCPTSFGKRFGPYITLKASSGNARKEYYYYYDSNLIEPR